MAEHAFKIVYLLAEAGLNGNRRTYWRPHGRAYVCRDGSLNLKLDIHPGLTFNIRDPKSNGEREEAEAAGDEDDESDRVFPCARCSRAVTSHESFALANGGAVCDDCVSHYKFCPECRRYFPKSEKSAVCAKCSAAKHEKLVTELAGSNQSPLEDDGNDSSFQCEDCLKTVSNDEAHALLGGGAVCDECGGKYQSCASCDYYFLRGLGGKVCPQCREER